MNYLYRLFWRVGIDVDAICESAECAGATPIANTNLVIVLC